MDAPVPAALRSTRNYIKLEEDRRAEQGAWLLLASLAIFFISSIILFGLYVFLRWDPAYNTLYDFHLPQSFLGSTLLLLGVSISLHYAVLSARRDQLGPVIWLSLAAMVMALIFFAIQGEGMYVLAEQSLRAKSLQFNLYPFVFLLALLHALHVVGGMISLTLVCCNALRRAYDHERHWGLQFCALYWHFLDIVWIVMMTVFVVTIWSLSGQS